MKLRLGAAAAFVAIVLAGAMTSAQSRPNPTVPELLAASAKYLAEYEKQFSAVVSEERYEQRSVIRGSARQGQRLLRSDVLVINGGPAGWISFRDVLEVDGKPVNDHKDRLTRLMTELEPDTIEQAMRLAEESARYNLGNVWRTINVPNTALVFLRRENQHRSKFTFGGMKTVEGARVAQLEFKEQAKPRVIGSKDDAAAEGKFWLDPASGRVVQTELALRSLGSTARITVRFADQPKVGMWLPVTMEEEYVIGLMFRTTFMMQSQVNGRAEYRNFRKFDVDVAMIIK